MNLDSVRDTVRHPATWIASGVAAFTSTLWLPIDPGIVTALAATIWAHAGTLFSAGSALAFLSNGPLSGTFAWIQPFALGLGGAGAVLYAAKLLDGFLDDFNDRLE